MLEQQGKEYRFHVTRFESFLSHHHGILQEANVLHTVSVFVAFQLRTVVGGFLHLAAALGDTVFAVNLQHEQSLLYVLV